MPVDRVARSAGMQTLLLSGLAGALAVASLLLLGLPGAAFMELATPLVGLVSRARLGGDQVWPAAILLSMFGPFALVPLYFVAARMTASRAGRVAVTTCLTVVANIGLAGAVLALGGE